MRILFTLTLFSTLVLGLCAHADFLPGTDDIPLMDGLTLPDADDFSFDTPAGQILIFEAKTSQPASTVRSFYDTTLMALGWVREKQDLYRRDKDTIHLSFPTQGSVRFDITLSAAMDG